MDDGPDDSRRERFGRLWRAHYPAVLAYARRRRPGAARYVASDTFLVAWRLDDVPDDARRGYWASRAGCSPTTSRRAAAPVAARAAGRARA